MKFNFFSLAVTISLVSILSAQGLTPIKIAGVEVEGNNITTATVVKYTSGILEGKEMVPGDFGKSVKKLWATGFFSDIQIQLDKETPEGLYITIIVEETPILGDVTFEGDKKKRRDIEEELDLKTGQRIRPHLLKESVETIKRLLAEDGYLRSEVDASLSEGAMDNVRDLTFNIKTRNKVKIGNIQFHNNEAFKDKKLRKELKDTKIQKWYMFWRSNYDKDKFREDKGLLTKFYQKNGYKDTISETSHGKETTFTKLKRWIMLLICGRVICTIWRNLRRQLMKEFMHSTWIGGTSTVLSILSLRLWVRILSMSIFQSLKITRFL